MIRTFFILCSVFPFAIFSADLPDIYDLVNTIDKLYRSDTSEASVVMKITTPHWERSLELDLWSKGMDETFIIVRSPKKDRGIATLRKLKEMWNYFPKVDKIIKVPPSLMMSSWMGSDFTNDDLVRESSYLQDYTPSYLYDPDTPDGHALVSLRAKAEAVTVWEEIRMLVHLLDYIPLEYAYYDEHGEKIRVMTFDDVQEMGGKKIPTRMEMLPLTEDKQGNITVITYTSAQFNHHIPNDVFSLRNLRKKQ